MNSSKKRRKASSGSKAANENGTVTYDFKGNPDEEKLMMAALLKNSYGDSYGAYTLQEVAEQFVVGRLSVDKLREYARPADASGSNGAATEDVLMDFDIHFLAKEPQSGNLNEVHIKVTARKPDRPSSLGT